MTNRICDILGIEKPIIQGPLLWLTDAKLVAAVSNAGGLGMLGFNAGQTEPTKSVTETMDRMRREIRKTKALTTKPFGLNFGPTEDWRNDAFTEPTLQLLIDEHIPVVSYVGPVIPELFTKLHENDIKIVYRYITPTIENAREAEANGADIIVATGFDEGGTVPERTIGTLSIVPMIADAVDVPVMAAGGITDARTAKAVMDLGAEGVYCGTAFLASEESRLADNIKRAMLTANAEDLLMYRTLPAFYRSLPGEVPNHLVELDQQGATKEAIFTAGNRYDGMRQGMLFGDLSKGFASFGLGISNIHAIEPVQTIVDRLAEGVVV
ncbi:NAD(P)H-dependent flavin oxidoreductase [Levilactobacillus yiduensis]|uniref:NAD(P)H-dependent flavin oxidoreductase n=1 Tax=Levilactobacillus yiduensis TaxID=2953880 RepID=UPI000EF32BAB|nr:nitronate monooxygenase [Levilactobacillus yiduensis]AYM01901.1 nitronate monooxygenase [Levilactobacillus brevis]